MRRHVHYGNVKIGFTIRFVPKQKRSISIHILPNGDVCIDAPEGTAPDDVVHAAGRRARWIYGQLEVLNKRGRQILPREYVSGESHLYLGRRYVLKVMRSACDEPGVKLIGGRLEVTTRTSESAIVRQLLDRWYRQRASEVFARRITDIAGRASWLKEEPGFRLLNMRTQWGSCSPKGFLLFNPQLIKAPRPCVDYVVSHELCHLKVHNHSAEYYRLLGTLLPDWQERKRELDDMAEMLLNR